MGGSCNSKGVVVNTPEERRQAAQKAGHRGGEASGTPGVSTCSKKDLIRAVHDGVIGEDVLLYSPFGGYRVMLYADYTASGRALNFIESYMLDEVLPMYGNTHSENSATAAQMHTYVHDARDAVLASVHGNEETDAVIFVGSGSTGAINKMARILGLDPSVGAFRYKKEDEDGGGVREFDTVVFISLMEHHSNILPWRESAAHVVAIDFDQTGKPDLVQLEEQLAAYKPRCRRMIGSFSAGSNITGRRIDVEAWTDVLHEYGALALWDYAAAAPYVDIHMGNKDAIFISTHKFVGGPGTPGVLVAKKKHFDDSVCVDPGGGTVVVVSANDHVYVDAPEDREAGGTPDILGIIRAGLVYQLMTAVGGMTIEHLEDTMSERVRAYLAQVPNLLVAGMSPESQLPIFSTFIRVPLPDNPESNAQMFLHYNFVVRLMSDLFGIQVRGGCACAGPYGFYLLTPGRERLWNEDPEVIVDMLQRPELQACKPGFVRFNVAWFLRDDEVSFLLEAFSFVAEHGWKFLPLYSMSDGGNWSYVGRSGQGEKSHPVRMKHLSEAVFTSRGMEHNHPQPSVWPPAGTDHAALRASSMDYAYKMADELVENPPAVPREQIGVFNSKFRWFLLPSDGACLLRGVPLPYVPPHSIHIRSGFTSTPVPSESHFRRSARNTVSIEEALPVSPRSSSSRRLISKSKSKSKMKRKRKNKTKSPSFRRSRTRDASPPSDDTSPPPPLRPFDSIAPH